MGKWTMRTIQRIAFMQLVSFALCIVTSQGAFGKGRMCCKIFTDNKCDKIENGQINNMDAKCVIVETKTDITPILLGGLALIGLLIIFLTVRVLRGTTGSSVVKARTEERVAKEPSLHYVQLSMQQTRRTDRKNRNLDNVEYTSVMPQCEDRPSRPRRPEFEGAIHDPLKVQGPSELL